MAFLVQQTVAAARDLQAGRRLVTSVRTASAAGLLEGEAADRLGEAAERFARANDRLESPLFTPVRALPVLGRHLRSLDALSGAGAEALDASHDALVSIRADLRGADPDPASRVELLSRLEEAVAGIRTRFEDLDLGPTEALVSPVADAHNQLAENLDEASDLVARTEIALGGVRDFLAGPSTYLLLVCNNAEMRAGQGMVLSVGEVTVVDGEITIGELFEAVDLRVPPGAVAIEGDLADRWGFAAPSEEWRSLGLSPRFDETAPLAARMWEALGHEPVDGVLAVDPFALRAVLRATGPVRVDAKRIGAGNVVEHALHGQYVALGSQTRRREQEERREDIDRIARASLDALTGRSVPAIDLVEELVTAGQGRHVLAWARDDNQQAAWEAARVDGSLESRSMLLSVLNRGENKLDWFVRTSASIEVDDGEVTVEVEVENTTPRGEPPYVAGPRDFGVAEGEYVGFLSLNVPGSASGGRIDGVDSPAAIGSDGPTRVLAATIRVPRGETATVVFRFALPDDLEEIVVEPSARSSPTEWSHRGVEWNDERSRTIDL